MRFRPEENLLQQQFNFFFLNITVQNKLVMNISKCFVMYFSCSKSYLFPPQFSIEDTQVLEVKKTYWILGIQVQDDMRWQAQVDEKGYQDPMGLKKNADLWGGPGLGGLLEGRGPGPPGASRHGPEGGHGGHNWEVGGLTQPPVTGPGSWETGGQALQTGLI